MLPRDTLKGFVIERVGFQPRVNPVRVTFLGTQYTPKKNPWDDLHNGTVKDEATLAEWELQIPAYGCHCRKFYLEYKANNPPDFSSEDALWIWGVGLHNAVNKKLDRLELTIDKARKIWNR